MIEPGIYKEVMASFPSGVTVVTTLDPEGGIVGIQCAVDRPGAGTVLPQLRVGHLPGPARQQALRDSPAVRRPAGRGLRLCQQGQGQGAGHRLAPQRAGQPAAGESHGHHRVRTVARVRRWRSRDHRRCREEPDPAKRAVDAHALPPRQTGRIADPGMIDLR
jgi:hypothetical protein